MWRRRSAVSATAFQRLGWGVADQAFSSVTNFALGVAVARTASAHSFGAFGIAFAVYTVSFGFARALTSDVLSVRYSAVSDQDWRRGTASATGTALVVGAIIGAGCLAVGITAHGALGKALIVLGPALPGLLLQDTWRYAFFAVGRPRSAFTNDLVWAIVLFPFLGVLSATDRSSVSWCMFAWEFSAVCAAMFGIWQARLLPDISAVRRWLIEHRDFIGPFLGEFAALRVSSQIVTFVVAALATLTAAGSLRGAFILLNPLNVFLLGFRNVVVPEGVRLLERSTKLLRSRTIVLSLGLGGLAAIWGTLLLFLPTRAGTALLGETWIGARPLILPLTLWMISSGFTIGPAAAVRSLAAVRRSLHTRVLISVITVVAAVAGAIAAGVLGAAWALGLTSCVGAGLWWWQFERAIAAYERARETGGDSRLATAVPQTR
jgi:O-antigen/teichoic acid export membrane protein